MELERYTEGLWESFYLLLKQLRPLHLFTSGRGQICSLIISEGAEYSTINLNRSAISKYHVGINGQPVGTPPLVKKALKSAIRRRPPLL